MLGPVGGTPFLFFPPPGALSCWSSGVGGNCAVAGKIVATIATTSAAKQARIVVRSDPFEMSLNMLRSPRTTPTWRKESGRKLTLKYRDVLWISGRDHERYYHERHPREA